MSGENDQEWQSRKSEALSSYYRKPVHEGFHLFDLPAIAKIDHQLLPRSEPPPRPAQDSANVEPTQNKTLHQP
eukprot:CAMPEP_0171486660 /NCGR_PEP_ID=MMETSP0958-20121227/1211_1 /TAXON_ID=87120 /ORGANISM="Aurantiochytrium limacinum, Strain ATCCMYA-1381" /LENGTH=72 /DNA_ID=CAMNT_0012019559 /DNA_START=334 /DNA_END=552 /DNA_ORIENTATION=-